MAKKQVLIRIDEDLNTRWGKLCDRLQISKTGMVEEILEQILPILEKEKPTDMIGSALRQVGMAIQETGSLFDEKK